MTQQQKQVFRRMNQDADVRSLQPGEFRFLRNGIVVQGTTIDGLEDVITSVYGNSLVTNASLESNSTIIGFLEDRINNRAFFAVYHASNPTIYQVTTAGVVSIVMRSTYLEFNSTDFVDMDIIGNILILTNNVGEIKKIDVAKAIAGTTYTPLLNEITLIKPPPLLPLTWALSYNDIVNNRLAGHYFQWYYRYIYENNDYSVFSPASKTTNSWDITGLDTVFLVSTTNLSSLSGEIEIDGITTSNSKILLVGQASLSVNGVWVTNAGAWSRHASYPAGASVSASLYVTSGENFAGTVWYITSQNLGTLNCYGKELDGPDKVTITRPATPPATVIGIEYAVRTDGSNELVVYRKEISGSFSSSHSFDNSSELFTVPDSESFKWSDSIPVSCKSLKIFKNRLFTFNNTEGYDASSSTAVTLGTTSVSGVSTPYPSTNKVFTCAKSGAIYNIGIVYFDAYRRMSSVLHESSIKTPEHATVITVNVGSITPPVWATHWAIVSTRVLNLSFFISHYTRDIFYFKEDADGTITYSKTLTGFDATGTFIDIGSLTSDQKGYTFSLGDRIKLIMEFSGFDNERVIDVPIISQVGNFVKTRLILGLQYPFDILTTRSNNIRFEIYSPSTESILLFNEIGETYAIADLTGTFTLKGDVERVLSNIYQDTSGDYSSTDPFANTYEVADPTTLKVYIERINLWGNTKWVTQSGRGIVKSATNRLSKKTSLRFSNPYIQGGSILGINTFDALNDYALPIENGPGTLLAEAGDVIVALHESESTAVYIGQGFVNTSSGNDFLAKTDNVIGDDRKYLGGHGTTHPTSVVERDSRVYFYDSKKGCIVRRSQDGLTRISDYEIKGFISYLTSLHNADPSNSRIVAGWDPQYECYCISFYLTGGSYNFTLYFHEKTNSWICATDLIPYRFGTLGRFQLSFTSTAALYIQTPEANYNKFFGVQYNRSLEWEIAPLESLMKILEGIEIDQTNIYSTAGTNEELLSVYLVKGGTKQTMINYVDFKQREGVWRSAFFKMITDVNFGSAFESKFKSPYAVRGQSFYMVLTYNGTDKNILKSITTFFRPKMLSSV